MTDADRFFETFVYYMRPPGADEAALCSEIDALPSVRVQAGDSTALLEQGFRKGECHRNCIRAEAERRGEQVFGWTVTPVIYLSHSILRSWVGRLQCITPQHTDVVDDDGCFEFRPDPAFSFDGTYMRRHGAYLPRSISIIRRDPVLVRDHYAALYERVQRGELSFADAAELGL